MRFNVITVAAARLHALRPVTPCEEQLSRKWARRSAKLWFGRAKQVFEHNAWGKLRFGASAGKSTATLYSSRDRRGLSYQRFRPAAVCGIVSRQQATAYRLHGRGPTIWVTTKPRSNTRPHDNTHS
jgi:hypothetical protein